MQVGCIFRHFGQGIINLVEQYHFFGIDVLHGYATFFAERHGPIVVKCATGVNGYWKRTELGIFPPTHSKKITDRGLNGSLFFIVPVYAENGESPVAGGGHPDMLDGSGPTDFAHCKGLPW